MTIRGSTSTIALRWLFMLGCLGCSILVLSTGRWEARLEDGTSSWIMTLAESPVWAPPKIPAYAEFKAVYKDLDGFPTPAQAGIFVRRVLIYDEMILKWIICLWPVTLIAGVAYQIDRKYRRDLILHLSLTTGIALTIAVALCLAVWLLLGGWGPPFPLFFGGLGLILGIFMGVRTFQPYGT